MDFVMNSVFIDRLTGALALDRQSLSLIGIQTAQQQQANDVNG